MCFVLLSSSAMIATSTSSATAVAMIGGTTSYTHTHTAHSFSCYLQPHHSSTGAIMIGATPPAL